MRASFKYKRQENFGNDTLYSTSSLTMKTQLNSFNEKVIKLCAIAVFVAIYFIVFSSKNNIYAATAKDSNGISWCYTVGKDDTGNSYAYDVYYYSGTIGSTLEIPSTLAGYTVIGIRGSSTSELTATSYRGNILNSTSSNTTVTKVIIPDTVTSIGNNTFANFRGLTEIKIPDSVTSIGAYAFYHDNSATGELKIPNLVTSIGNYAFYYCSSLTSLNLGNSVTSIGNNAFYDCGKFTGKLTIPDSVISIGNYAFKDCTFTSLDLGNGVKSIGDYAFYSFVDSKLSGNLIIPNSVTTIGSNAFNRCSELTGDLIIPDSVTYLGYNAFSNCTGFDGMAIIGNGLTSISSSAFAGDINFKKISLSSSITEIEYSAFYRISDIWIDNTEGNVELGNYEGHVHWKNGTHNVEINALPGVKLINIDNNQVVKNGDYACETEFRYRVEIENGYSYTNLKLIEINDNDTENYKSYDIKNGDECDFTCLLRDRKVYVEDISEGVDLSLRTFIYSVNREKITESRESVVNVIGGKLQYLHTKYPYTVKQGDLITYKIRVYNEGTEAGKATKVSVYIPEGLEFDETIQTNILYKWKVEKDGKLSTDYTSQTNIDEYKGNGVLNYNEISLDLRVAEYSDLEENIRLNIIAEIEAQSSTDADSICGSIQSAVGSDYKLQESNTSTPSSYVRGEEDDDDFESILILAPKKVEYKIAITQNGESENVVLPGVTYNLINEDGKIIDTQTTDENGNLEFESLVSNADEEDIYYIQATELKDSLENVEKLKIKVTVTKMLQNDGSYEISVSYSTMGYETNIEDSVKDWIPVKTAEQLKQIGSGNTIEIDGTEYVYAVNAHYKIENDIDLDGIEWTPISSKMDCIIDGGNHKISNLTITEYDENEILSIGLFREFSGVIKDLNFEKVNIDINIDETAEFVKSDYTGVGAIAGIMNEGYIINCTVSGQVSATTDNVGGFIGHTAKGGIVKIVKCNNSASVTINNSHSNAGGIIGCALGTINVTETNNLGEIVGTKYNVGGLVGFVNATDYGSSQVIVNCNNDTVNFSIYSKDISNDEKNSLDNKAVFVKCVNTGKVSCSYYNSAGIVGTSYCVVEMEECINMAEIFSVYNSAGGMIAELRTNNNDCIYWGRFSNFNKCKNYGTIQDAVPASALGGIVGQGFAYIKINNCENSGPINSLGAAGGMIGKIDGFIMVDNCINNSTITSKYNGSAVGGIIGENQPISYEEIGTEQNYIYVNNCKNYGNINTSSHLGGIIGATVSKLVQVKNCEVKGENENLNMTGGKDNGGIIGYCNSETIIVEGCTVNKVTQERNDSSNSSSGGTGGIIGFISIWGNDCLEVKTVKISNCNVSECTIKSINKEVGGILGGAYENSSDDTSKLIAENLITDCIVSNCVIFNDQATGTYGGAGGIVGKIRDFNLLNINNCVVKDGCDIKCNNSGGDLDVGGIMGNAEIMNNVLIEICDVSDSYISGYESYTGSYGYSTNNVGGIVAATMNYINGVDINNCNVKGSIITTNCNNLGGIIALGDFNSSSTYGISIANCNLLDSTVASSCAGTEYGCTSGIIAGSGQAVNIKNCSVLNDIISSVKSANTAGILGLTWGTNLENRITDCIVSNTDIISEKEFEGYSSNNSTAGLVGFTNKIVLENCIVEKGDDRGSIVAKGSQISGGVAGAEYIDAQNCSIKGINIECNSTVLKSSYTSNRTMSGFFGSQANNTGKYASKLQNINIEDVTITGVPEVAGGIFAYMELLESLENCSVINLNIKQRNNGEETIGNGAYNGAIGSLGGIINKSSQPIKNNTVSNSIIDIGIQTGGGLIGATLNDITIDNCNVDSVTLTNPNISYGTGDNNGSYYALMGGLVGYSTDITIQNNTTVKNSNINIKYGTNKPAYAGGIIGYSKGIVTIDKTNVTNTNVENETQAGITGGIVGMLDYDSSTSVDIEKNVTISNSSVENCENISGQCHTGGLVGFVNQYLDKTIINNCVVDSTTINNNTTSAISANIGGFVGISTIVEINSSTVKNSNINVGGEVNRAAHAGGFIGISKGDLTINNTNLISTNVDNETLGGITGGMIGLTDNVSSDNVKTLTINNSSIENCKKILGNLHVGGILGVGKIISNGNNIIKNSNIKGLAYVGGVVGTSINGSVIEGVTAENITVCGTVVSGVVGGIDGMSHAKIKNTIVKGNSKIYSTSTNAQVGGIAGHSSYEENVGAENCTVENSTIAAPKGIVGGIFGFSNSAPINSTVTGTEIKTTKSGVFGLV